MARKTRQEEYDAQKFIESLQPEDFSVPIPRHEGDATDSGFPMEDATGKPQTKGISTDKPQVASMTYEETFIRDTDITARKGKQVSVRNEYHERIWKILQVIGRNEITIANYVDNVLAHHFETYGNAIAESFNRHIKSYNL